MNKLIEAVEGLPVHIFYDGREVPMVSYDAVIELIYKQQPVQVSEAAINRAILMLRIAGTHCHQYGSQDLSFYDGVDCDGVCIEADCHAAADELAALEGK